MTAGVIWTVFVLLWLFPKGVGSWLAEVTLAFSERLEEKAGEHD